MFPAPVDEAVGAPAPDQDPNVGCGLFGCGSHTVNHNYGYMQPHHGYGSRYGPSHYGGYNNRPIHNHIHVRGPVYGHGAFRSAGPGTVGAAAPSDDIQRSAIHMPHMPHMPHHHHHHHLQHAAAGRSANQIVGSYQQTYAAPAPTVKCGKNILIGCQPSVQEVPCQPPAYGSAKAY